MTQRLWIAAAMGRSGTAFALVRSSKEVITIADVRGPLMNQYDGIFSDDAVKIMGPWTIDEVTEV